MKSLITRMDKHLTFTEAQQYKMRCGDEIMEYLRLEPKRTGLNVVLYVDDGNAHKRHGHQLLLFIRNGYNDSEQEYIPMSISPKPYVLDDNMEFRVSYDDIFDVMDFIQNNATLLTELGNGKINAEVFVQSIQKIGKGVDRLVVEETQLLLEMPTLKKEKSHLPVDIWIDNSKLYQGHAPRIKFRASNDQRTTNQYSTMLITDPQIIENFPDNCPIRKKDIEKIQQFVKDNQEMLIQLCNQEIDYFDDFLPNIKFPNN